MHINKIVQSTSFFFFKHFLSFCFVVCMCMCGKRIVALVLFSLWIKEKGARVNRTDQICLEKNLGRSKAGGKYHRFQHKRKRREDECI
ncbi:hypothetical protein BD560DRAFT_417283 [Blakeslea trispora]|nr:hypothetical protein BD560DRAFT_417283 [Blakeslea trispora]